MNERVTASHLCCKTSRPSAAFRFVLSIEPEDDSGGDIIFHNREEYILDGFMSVHVKS
jgi:hypothetical protein